MLGSVVCYKVQQVKFKISDLENEHHDGQAYPHYSCNLMAQLCGYMHVRIKDGISRSSHLSRVSIPVFKHGTHNMLIIELQVAIKRSLQTLHLGRSSLVL